VLRRLSSTNAPATAAAFTPTAATLPYLAALLFVAALILTVRNQWRARWHIDRPATALAITALVATPFLFTTLGFIAASTVTFVVIAMALRPPPRRPSLVDAVVGAVFAGVLFVIFTRALGVSLPAGSLFQ